MGGGAGPSGRPFCQSVVGGYAPAGTDYDGKGEKKLRSDIGDRGVKRSYMAKLTEMNKPEHKTAQPARAMTDEDLNNLYAMLMCSALKATPVFDEAQDLVQESLARTMEQVSMGVNVRYFKAYCFKVLASLKSRMFSDRRRHILVADLPENAAQGRYDYYSMELLMEELFALLPDTERRVVELYDLEALPLDQVAARLGLSVSYTERMLGKAHSFIKDKLLSHHEK